MMGSIAGLTSETTEKKTTLQKELDRFIIIVAIASLMMGSICVIVWAAWLRTSYPDYLPISSMLVNVISVMIAFIPEGLPVCVTLSLLLIARRMAKYNVLVKELSTIETLSCVNVIASDKTGTLTQNKMFVASASAGLFRFDLEAQKKQNLDLKSIGFDQLVASSYLCNNASFDLMDNQADVNIRKAKGDATDVALLRFSTQYQKLPNLEQYYEVLTEIPFNSKNKWMMKIVRPNETTVNLNIKQRSNSVISNTARTYGVDLHKQVFKNDEQDLILLKGAPDYLIKKCSRIINEKGDVKQITKEDLDNLIELQNDWCMLGQRVLLICKNSIDFAEIENAGMSVSDIEGVVHTRNDFCIIGLVGIIDPPREGITDVVNIWLELVKNISFFFNHNY
jgi:sodium/potassium-transporting ATPase subunit alpha